MNQNNNLEFFENEAPSTMPIVTDVCFTEEFEVKLTKKEKEQMPILVIRDLVFFPGIAYNILIGRPKSLKLISHLTEESPYFVAVTQKNSDIDYPSEKDIYEYGVVAKIFQLKSATDGMQNVVIQAYQRVQIQSITETEPFMRGSIKNKVEKMKIIHQAELGMLRSLMTSHLREVLAFALDKNKADDVVNGINSFPNVLYCFNYIASLLPIEVKDKQLVLEENDVLQRGMLVQQFIVFEREKLKLKASIEAKTQREIDQQQKEYFLRQEIKTIQDELENVDVDPEIQEMRDKASKMKWTQQTKEAFERGIAKLSKLPTQSPDYSVELQYLRVLLSLPWNVYTEDKFNLDNAENILNRDHYGLEKVKERILEFLAVLSRKKDMKAPIICLYGPPGVGKTSLGKSIADSLGRKYARISLGGIHDESEIRGHRRTYIGSMPGRIIKNLQKVESSNPVFILDEIDKVSNDYKGDPSSALLEVLDPEQNYSFHDNYIDLDYDLSKILFIATANDISQIPKPLLDRMELIEVSGYTLEEKVEIGVRHLMPKQLEEHGYDKNFIELPRQTIEHIIDGYTRESGVRGLNKKISQLIRKFTVQNAKAFSKNGDDPKLIDLSVNNIENYLGPVKFVRQGAGERVGVGIGTGLAWTSVGGEVLYIETIYYPGKEPKLILTGNLGDVMKESAQIAFDWIRSNADNLGINKEIIETNQFHIHVPEGAIPKDGPSAGITMVVSLVSAMKRIAPKSNIAMTGEFTLSGRVLPVGGVKEKILAAKRLGLDTIILSQENERDIKEIDAKYIDKLTIKYVTTISQVLENAFSN